MKKKLLFLMLMFQATLVLAQEPTDTIKVQDINTAECITDISKLKPEFYKRRYRIPIETTFKLALQFANENDSKKAEQQFSLKNFAADGRLMVGAANKDYLLFDLGKPLDGVKNAVYQLTNKDGKICYNYTLLITEYKEGDEQKADVPPLVLTPYIANVDPCTSCTPVGNIITYDFSANTLKNSKTISSTNREFSDGYLRKHWKLPRVGEELTFQIININPFKFDIALTDEPISINTEAPAGLIAAFTFPEGVGAVGASAKKNEKEQLEKALVDLDKALDNKVVELRNAGDCLNPCSYVQSAVLEICEYFEKYFGYKDQSLPLENLLTGKIKEHFSADTEKDKAKELNAIVTKLYTFRHSAVGTFSYRIPQLKNVDQYLFKLNITPKTNVSTNSRLLNQEINVDILGGFKVDVTSGLFFTKLRDDKYIARADSLVLRTASGYGDSIVYNRRKKIINESGSKYDFGVASMFHFYKKVTANYNLALSLGVGVTLNESPKLRYLTGITFLGGKTSRLALTYGLSFGYVDRLSDRYNDVRDALGNVYVAPSENKIDYKKKFESKSFIALTYSLPIFKKKEEVKAAATAAPTGTEKKADEAADGKNDKAAGKK